jgi:hypothetical protein
MIPASERVKAFHALDRAATVMGQLFLDYINSAIIFI